MPRTPRRRIAEGIYLDKYSLTAKVQVGTGEDAWTKEQAFARDTPTKEIQAWRETTRSQMLEQRPNVSRGSIAAELHLYLERVRKRPASWKSKRSEMRAWVDAIGALRRHQVKPKDIDATIAAWLDADVSKKTILNRCRTLHHFYVTMADDKKVRTPLDNVDVPMPEKRRPIDVPASVIVRTEKRLRGGDAKTRARFMVMATTGIRPSQLKRLSKEFVNLRRRVVDISGGKGGEPIVHVLNGEMLAAWRAFIEADAWGEFDSTKFAGELHDAGWPTGVRPYNVKHALGIRLADGGADAEDIRAWFGHTDTKTTRIYTGVPLARMRRLSAQLDNRFGWAKAPRVTPREGQTTLENPGKQARNSRRHKSA